jgi:antitoxin ParD1/3/4
MGDVRGLDVVLPDEQVAALHEAVATGEYGSASDIIREAVRDWQMKRALRPEEVANLGWLWDQGKASGPAVPLDFAEARREARERLARIRLGLG